MKGNKKNNSIRFATLFIILAVIYVAILLKLFTLQVVNYDEHKERASSTSFRLIAQQAPRGTILDSSGLVLAGSKLSYAVEYIETQEAKAKFFDTMSRAFSILDELGEVQKDDFKLKIDENQQFYMEYSTSEPSAVRSQDLRFKKDRNLDYYLKQELDDLKKIKVDLEDLNEEQTEKLNEEVRKVSPEEMFYRLVKQYELYLLLDPTDEEIKTYKEMSGEEITEVLKQHYSLNEIRRYMVVKDALKMQSYSGYNPITVASNIKDESAFIFMQRLNELPGIDVRLQPVRYYPYGSLASSVVGYMSSINSSNQYEYELKGYDISSDKIGISGIEAAYEEYLKGSKGGTVVKVNKYGRITKELYSKVASPGDSVQLSIDASLQYTAERALEETLRDIRNKGVIDGGKNIVANATRGAVVVTEVNTGRVLALASYPNFDPNIFTIPGMLTTELSKQYFTPDYEAFAKEYIKKTGSTKTVEQLFSDDFTMDTYDIYAKPFFNYATQGAVPPGSTFKYVTATAALEEGLANPNEKIPDLGIFNQRTGWKNYQGMCEIYNSRRSTHGNIDMAEAFRVSCNYYFYELAARLYVKDGYDKLAEYAWKLGLGSNPDEKGKSGTGIEIVENPYGQVYNYASYSNIVVNYARFEIVDMLTEGVYSIKPDPKNVHTGFNIAYNSEDDEELDAAKSEVKTYITGKLKEKRLANKDEEYNQIFEEVSKRLRSLVTHYSENEQAKYTDEDFEIAAKNMAGYIVNDKSADINAPGNLTNAAIGLGMNNFTPLQLSIALGTVLNGGTRYKANLADRRINSDGVIVEEYKPVVLDRLELKDSTVAAIKAGLGKVHSTGAFANFPIATGGKTGTSIFREDQKSIGRSDYGVYIGFAPLDDPEISVSVVLYDAAHGSSAAPVVKAVFENYFRDILKQQYPGYSSPSTSYTLDPPITSEYGEDN